MQKLILFVCMLLHTMLSGMEKQTYSPCICIDETFYQKTSLEDNLFKTLSKKFSHIPYMGLHCECDILFHRSPLISTIHSSDYLQELKKNHSHINLATMLKQSSVTVVATKHLLEQLDTKEEFPHYVISLGEGYSFAGYNNNHHGHTYAAIPAAALYALNTQLVDRIAIIDEYLNESQNDHLYQQGNGSIFFSQNSKLADLFDNKVVTLKEIRETSQFIDLAFYNINIENSNESVKKRLLSIANLLNKSIPTVFILSGDKNKYFHTVYSIIDYIDNITQLLFTRYITPRLAPTTSVSHPSSLDSSSDDKSSTSDDESSSTSSSDMGERFSFKIITDPEQILPDDNFNYVYLTKNITIDNNEAMEVVLDENYPRYGGRYHSTTSSSSQ